jgi:cytoskeletal protein CcmA (bactofilin family)
MFKKNNKQQPDISQQEISTLIGEGYIFTGEINGPSVIRIEGKIIGDVNVEGGIVLGENGNIHGNITTASAIIYGTVTGNVKTTHLEIKKTGHVNGDIITDTLEVEIGAKYNGRLSMHEPEQEQLKEAS